MHSKLHDIFDYAFNEVASVFFNRYPNSYAPHIMSEDVLSREITRDTITTRKLIVKQGSSFLKKVPKWMSGQTNVQFMPTLEVSVFDRRTNTLRSHTSNVSHVNRLNMCELCEYRKMDDGRTSVSRELTVSANCRFHSLVEKVLLMTFRKSVRKTIKGYNEKLIERFGPKNPGLTGGEQQQQKRNIAEELKKKREKLRLGRDTA